MYVCGNRLPPTCTPPRLSQLKKAALRKELDRLDSLQFLSERDVPLREEDLR